MRRGGTMSGTDEWPACICAGASAIPSILLIAKRTGITGWACHVRTCGGSSIRRRKREKRLPIRRHASFQHDDAGKLSVRPICEKNAGQFADNLCACADVRMHPPPTHPHPHTHVHARSQGEALVWMDKDHPRGTMVIGSHLCV
jgi:hypothetical protein